MNPDPFLLSAFVSHAWAGNFDEFVESVLSIFVAWIAAPNLWISLLALNQSRASVSPSPLFLYTLARAKSVCIIRNKTVDIYQRMWCCWELYLASRSGLPVTFAGPVSSSPCKPIDISCAETTNEYDKRMILERISVGKRVKVEVNKELERVRDAIDH